MDLPSTLFAPTVKLATLESMICRTFRCDHPWTGIAPQVRWVLSRNRTFLTKVPHIWIALPREAQLFQLGHLVTSKDTCICPNLSSGFITAQLCFFIDFSVNFYRPTNFTGSWLLLPCFIFILYSFYLRYYLLFLMRITLKVLYWSKVY